MAEGDASGNGGGSFGFLTHKIGPMPAWMWGLLAVGVYYWYTHYYQQSSSTTAATAPSSSGSSGTIALSGPPTIQPLYGTSAYKTNGQWEAAAINYLAGHSVPPNEASTAIWNYIHGKQLTQQEQKDVNLAIAGIGSPPTVPQPGGVQKPPVTAPPPPPPSPAPQPGGQWIPASKGLGRYHFHSISQSQAQALHNAGGPVYAHVGNRFYENVNPAQFPGASFQTTSWGQSHYPSVFHRSTPKKK